jgi:hypothetical protein
MNLIPQAERKAGKATGAHHRAAHTSKASQGPRRRRPESRHPLPKAVLGCRQDKEEVPLLAPRVHSARPVNDLGVSATFSRPRIDR